MQGKRADIQFRGTHRFVYSFTEPVVEFEPKLVKLFKFAQYLFII